jgi:hypothetical protein
LIDKPETEISCENRVFLKEFKGQKILMVDYSNLKVDNDILKVFEAVIKLIENHDGELRSCINFRNCNLNNKVFKNFKKDRNILFRVKKRAVIGVFGIDKLLLKAFYLLDRNETKTFKTELEALNFLAQ